MSYRFFLQPCPALVRLQIRHVNCGHPIAVCLNLNTYIKSEVCAGSPLATVDSEGCRSRS